MFPKFKEQKVETDYAAECFVSGLLWFNEKINYQSPFLTWNNILTENGVFNMK